MGVTPATVVKSFVIPIAPEERADGIAAPKFDLRAGFSDTVAWYRTAAWMKH